MSLNSDVSVFVDFTYRAAVHYHTSALRDFRVIYAVEVENLICHGVETVLGLADRFTARFKPLNSVSMVYSLSTIFDRH
jgi:hypothetical protein